MCTPRLAARIESASVGSSGNLSAWAETACSPRVAYQPANPTATPRACSRAGDTPPVLGLTISPRMSPPERPFSSSTAAICSAAASSLFGIFLTPLLVALLLGTQGDGGSTLDAIGKITLQLLLPFMAGQIARRWIGTWVTRNKNWLKFVDQGSILLVVYSAFSAAVVEGIWNKVSLPEMLALLVACLVLLAVVLTATMFGSRALGFSKADEVAIVFCGSKKSLATGVPMAGILFPGPTAGILVLPVMLFHQVQLMACSVLAQRYGARPSDEA